MQKGKLIEEFFTIVVKNISGLKVHIAYNKDFHELIKFHIKYI